MDYSKSKHRRSKGRPSKRKRVKNMVVVFAFRAVMAVLLVGAFALAGTGIGLYLGVLRNAPPLGELLLQTGHYTSFIICGRTGEEIATLFGEQNRIHATSEQIPEHLRNAFVAIEDERFFSHNGVDFRSMVRALHTNLTDPTRTEGASTITQQLIKNMQNLTRNNLVTKLQEQYLAVQFERALVAQLGSVEAAKDYILVAYLNEVNLGRNWHGVQVAARNYFGKDVSELTLSESAVIAAITQNPSRYMPDRRPEQNRYRQVRVLNNMLRLGMITPEEFEYAINDPVYDRVISGVHGPEASVHSYFVDALIRQVAEDLQAQFPITSREAFNLVYSGGLRIYSTQDLRIQEIVDDVFLDDSFFPNHFEIDVVYYLTTRNTITNRVSNHSERATLRNRDQIPAFEQAVQNELLTANDIVLSERTTVTPQPQAAFVLMDHHTGHVLAIAGGRGEKQGSLMLCRATFSTRSPGSQFKVLAAFAPGVDLGIFSPSTLIDDAPFERGGYTPANWWGSRWYGPSTVRRAVYHSMNVVSVRAFADYLGPEVGFQYLRNFGFTTLEGTLRNGVPFRDAGYAVPLGGLTLGVNQLELAAAYAAIANRGVYNPPVLYTRVYNNAGELILENLPRPHRVMQEAAAYLVTDMMIDTTRRGTGTQAALRNTTMPVSGKTGTSQYTHDLGFTGYTPYFTAAIWLGYDQPRTMRGLDRTHMQMWRAIMERVHSELELPVLEFERPPGIASLTVCRDSGLLASAACSQANRTITGLFVAGSGPTETCTGHVEILFDTLTNLRAGPHCPPEIVERRVIFVRPGEELPVVCPWHQPNAAPPGAPGAQGGDASTLIPWWEHFPGLEQPPLPEQPPPEALPEQDPEDTEAPDPAPFAEHYPHPYPEAEIPEPPSPFDAFLNPAPEATPEPDSDGGSWFDAF